MHAQPPSLVVPAAIQPVTVDEVKKDMDLLHFDDDQLLEGYIAAAVSDLDGWSGTLGRCIINQVWSQGLDNFPPGDTLRLPFPNVSTVNVTYWDPNNVQQTLASNIYSLAHDATAGLIKLVKGAAWPQTADRIDAVMVQVTAGYGPAASDVPMALRIAITKHVRQLRGMDGGSGPGHPVYDHLIGKYRRVAF